MPLTATLTNSVISSGNTVPSKWEETFLLWEKIRGGYPDEETKHRVMTWCNNVTENFQWQGQKGMFSNINDDRYNCLVVVGFAFNPDQQKWQDKYNLTC